MPKKKKKRKPSKYNLHVKKEMLAGKSMSQASKSWNKGNPKPRKKSTRKKPTRKKITRRRTTRPQKQSFGFGPFPLLSGFFGDFRTRIQNRPRLLRR